MTLRHRLQLVYLIVVLLSAATVGVAMFELRQAGQIIAELQEWGAIVLRVERLNHAFKLPAAGVRTEEDFENLIPEQRLELLHAPDYLDVSGVRQALNRVQLQYGKWRKLSDEERSSRLDMVSEPLDKLALVVRAEQRKLSVKASKQRFRTMVLLMVVVCLTVIHIAVIGSLLRRWLLAPIRQLGRQVDALARDEPPSEPLLEQPPELASLANALDDARVSLGRARQQLLEAERLTTIGQFAAQLAHNLRNPLASIRANAQVAARRGKDEGYVQERMNEVVASVDSLNRWIAGLLEVARPESVVTTDDDVVPTLYHVKEALMPELAKRELELLIDAPTDGLICPHAAPPLQQALVAMATNAIEASRPGGRVVLRAQRVLSDDGEGDLCRISVEDDGNGLPADDPERIFEFSFSTKAVGMGLGLALARLGVRRLGGEAHAMNKPDGGAVVYVDLPLPRGKGKPVAEAAEDQED